jgi:hypothetical protein
MLSEMAEQLRTQPAFSKYHERACVEEKLLTVIPQSQKVDKPYSPLLKIKCLDPVHTLIFG